MLGINSIYHLSQVGPLPKTEATKLEDGPLGGLFWDRNLVEVTPHPTPHTPHHNPSPHTPNPNP